MRRIKSFTDFVNESESTTYYNHWDRTFTMKDFVAYFVDKLGMFDQIDAQAWFDRHDINDDTQVCWVSSSSKPSRVFGMSPDEWKRINDMPETDLTKTLLVGQDGYVIPEINDGGGSVLFVLHSTVEESAAASEILYHGTTKKFDKFEIAKPVANAPYNATPDNGIGIFFTDNPTMAKWFAGMVEFDGEKGEYVNTHNGGRLVMAKAKLESPYVIKGTDPDNEDDGVQEYFDQIKKAGGADKFKNALVDKGHDGIVIEDCNTNYYEDGTYKVVIVFDPADIKMVGQAMEA